MVVVVCECEIGSSLKFIWFTGMLQSYMHGYVAGDVVRLTVQKMKLYSQKMKLYSLWKI